MDTMDQPNGIDRRYRWGLLTLAESWIWDHMRETGVLPDREAQFDFAMAAMEVFAEARNDVVDNINDYADAILRGSWPLSPNVPGKGHWFVYILRRDGQAVYIGMTGNLRQRLKAHKTNRGPLVQDWVAHPFLSKEEAFECEQRWIAERKPEMNSWSAEA